MEYEEKFPDFKDKRLDAYCCYCGGSRFSATSSRDHTPSGGLLDDPNSARISTVRVCKRCNQEWSKVEAYSYCAISSYLSQTWKHSQQVLSKAKKILKSDKRLRRRIFSELNIDQNNRIFWKPHFGVIDRFFLKQALGHLFLETGELAFSEQFTVDWKLSEYMTCKEQRHFFSKRNDVYPELGSRAFIRLMCLGNMKADSFEIDANGFNVVEEKNYRFRVLFSDGKKEVQSIIRDQIYVSVEFP